MRETEQFILSELTRLRAVLCGEADFGLTGCLGEWLLRPAQARSANPTRAQARAWLEPELESSLSRTEIDPVQHPNPQSISRVSKYALGPTAAPAWFGTDPRVARTRDDPRPPEPHHPTCQQPKQPPAHPLITAPEPNRVIWPGVMDPGPSRPDRYEVCVEPSELTRYVRACSAGTYR